MFKVLCNLYKEIKLVIKLCNIDENGQLNETNLKTVGCVYDRYRLVHRWVPEMVLNVQSEFLIKKNSIFLISRVLHNCSLNMISKDLCLCFYIHTYI